MKFYFEYSPWLLIPMAIVAVAIAIFLYHKDKTFIEIEPWKRKLMTALRAIFIFLTMALLLNPIVKHLTYDIRKPIVVIAQDNSKSILYNKDSAFYKNEYTKNITQLANDLSDKFDVCMLPFSDGIENSDSITFTGDATNISSVFSEISSRYAGANMGAVILATDGIYNKGQNPQYASPSKYPVMCIAMGDTVPHKDLMIKDIVHNSVTFLGNKFPVRILVSADKCSEKQAQIKITRKGQSVYASNFDLPENGTTKSIEVELSADLIGLQQYKVSLQHLDKETSYENNDAEFYIEVIDKRSKILILADAPHPDVGAIKSALKSNPDLEIETKYSYENNISAKGYDLVIVHQLPTIKNKAQNVFTEIEKFGIPQIFILGTQTSFSDFDKLGTDLKVNANFNSFDDAVPSLNSSFNSFTIDAPEFLQQLPPLKVPYGSPKITGESKILLYQTINGIKTEKPLVFFTDRDNRKCCYIMGEGLWRWRIYDYKQSSSNENFNTLINKIVRFTITKQQKNKLNVEAKRLYTDNENIIITAEFYNDAYELVPDLEIEATLKDSTDNEFKYMMEPNGNSYRIDLGRLGKGNYTCNFATEFDGNKYETNIAIMVRNLNLEAQNITANHNVLYSIAGANGGKVYYPSEISRIKDDLEANPNIQSVSYEKESLSSIIDFWYIFVCILLFAATEWFLRKFWGGY